MSTILTDEANARLHTLYRAKLARAEATLAEFVASPIPSDAYRAKRRSMAITRWTNRVDNLRQKVGV